MWRGAGIGSAVHCMMSAEHTRGRSEWQIQLPSVAVSVAAHHLHVPGYTERSDVHTNLILLCKMSGGYGWLCTTCVCIT